MKIITYIYEKVPVKDTELFIPKEPFYCFQTYIRRAIRIIPKFVIWDNDPNNKKGDVYELEVTCVYQSSENIIEKFNVKLSMMENYINNNEKNKPAEISRMLLDEDYYIRTKEQFDIDLKTTLSNFKL